jgi:hypothetical protein
VVSFRGILDDDQFDFVQGCSLEAGETLTVDGN